MQENINKHYRGLHIVVINPANGEVVAARVFDTYDSSDDLEDFIDSGIVKDNSIVIVACKDDCITKLSNKCKTWFENMGSKLISQLSYRQGFAFISKIGEK